MARLRFRPVPNHIAHEDTSVAMNAVLKTANPSSQSLEGVNCPSAEQAIKPSHSNRTTDASDHPDYCGSEVPRSGT